MSFFSRYARFAVFLAVAVTVAAGLSLVVDFRRAILIGFDTGVAVFLGLAIHLFGNSAESVMRKKAAANDPDQYLLTIISFIVGGIVLTALFVELTGAGGRRGIGLAIAGATLLFAWLFANLLFAFHYAHVWYLPRDDGDDCAGLDFPGGDKTPEYWDFAYFAFVLGMTFQVADVNITSQRMRKLALLHGFMAFIFNIVVVALSVGLIGSALGSS